MKGEEEEKGGFRDFSSRKISACWPGPCTTSTASLMFCCGGNGPRESAKINLPDLGARSSRGRCNRGYQSTPLYVIRDPQISAHISHSCSFIDLTTSPIRTIMYDLYGTLMSRSCLGRQRGGYGTVIGDLLAAANRFCESLYDLCLTFSETDRPIAFGKV
ncbi:hypothetical protein J6590_049241 [Homalodisca vitripennis]|nr:hypothetical protein J6590_049241 [Homalodisca vitripennis]